MPFDGLTADYIASVRSLADRLGAIGITPVADTILETHKQEQVDKNPGNWAYYHRNQIEIACSLSGLIVIVMFIVGLAAALTGCCTGYIQTVVIGALLTSIAVVATVLFVVNEDAIEFKSPAKWREDDSLVRFCYGYAMPTDIKNLMADIASRMPHLRLIYGKLRQDREVLDPYIIVYDRLTYEKAVIGIWDGDQILHIATRT